MNEDDREDESKRTEYERRKNELPELSPEEYVVAICQIADELEI